ncbi:MAG: 3-methyl-2-oxobutanoate hydroxymethyltransferase [Pelagibacteraceae bacterium]|jgi:3-methyl-2-oxobutanoate hydroxymethyltransferase|nr:3-methyl-2-oxobutanoate hydroxymethyltransferase [Pelagibacteraceae bacterium]MBT3901539.1 3-methyl-2-oxobutanoate hydroxymethyltransferase [Pelagibacteraceae bacterium]MBT4645118.1 3-methyl-2-oxobutanoate hydroxymethyltransferase [Pelagibacteraceae bacterium]MBT4951110.1 3-methyl-2-oxobutanoate hydroxymethyltransferase [Pelagibacteraceae bacterium]MBT5214597.1 3-methyl-2-oxobutanoate hydroxymethyltransferase [Pelagibacteraceae bacterium]
MLKKYKKIYSLAHQAGYRNYTVRDLLELKGKKKLTQINVVSANEAAAAEIAGIDLLITGADNLKAIREAAPNTFLTCGIKYTEHESKESIAKKCFELVELGVDSIHTNSWNINFIKYISEFNIPLQGHVGFVPMMSTWTGGVKPVGKTSREAIKIFKDIKELEKIGCWAVEVECVPKDVLAEMTQQTKMLTVSIGSGIKGDVQFLFAEDILGYHHSSTVTPRHAKSYCNFNKIYNNMQKERIDAFQKFQLDVETNKFPSIRHSIIAKKEEVNKFKKLLVNLKNGNK